MSDRRVSFGRLGWWSARHPWLVAALWLGVLVGATIGHRALGGAYSDDFSLPGTPAEHGAALLKAHHVPPVGGPSGQLVFTVRSGSLARDRTAIGRSVARVRLLPHVVAASNPLLPGLEPPPPPEEPRIEATAARLVAHQEGPVR